MLDLYGLTVLPDFILEVGGAEGGIDVVRDYSRISHIEISFRQDLQDETGFTC